MKKRLFLASALLLVGCAYTGLQKTQWADTRFDLTWPQPPNEPRIHFLRSLQGPEDFGEAGSLRRAFNWLSGGEIEKNPSLSKPSAVAADGKGRVWVADTGTSLVHLFDLTRQRIDYISAADEMPFSFPAGIAYDPLADRIYISDALLRKVFAFHSDGSFISELDMPAGFRRPAGLAVDREGRLYVVDVLAGTVSIFSPSGECLKTISGGAQSEQKFNHPLYVSTDADGRIYVSDSMNFHVDIFDSSGRFLKSVGEVGDSPGTFARLKGVAVGPEGYFYASDAAFDNIQIFDESGTLRFYFGSAGTRPGQFSLPAGIFIDSSDRLYVADTQNSRLQIFQYLSPTQTTQ